MKLRMQMREGTGKEPGLGKRPIYRGDNVGHLERCDNASEGQRTTSQGHTPRAQAGTEHGPLCGHGDKAWIREEVRVCRVIRRPRRWAHVRALGRPPRTSPSLAPRVAGQPSLQALACGEF